MCDLLYRFVSNDKCLVAGIWNHHTVCDGRSDTRIRKKRPSIMKIAPPGGELNFYTVLCMIGALAAIWLGITHNSFFFIYAVSMGIPAAGMWLGFRWCGWVFLALLVVTIPLAIVAIFLLDDTLSERVLRLLRIAVGLHFGWHLYLWVCEDTE